MSSVFTVGGLHDDPDAATIHMQLHRGARDASAAIFVGTRGEVERVMPAIRRAYNAGRADEGATRASTMRGLCDARPIHREE